MTRLDPETLPAVDSDTTDSTLQTLQRTGRSLKPFLVLEQEPCWLSQVGSWLVRKASFASSAACINIQQGCHKMIPCEVMRMFVDDQSYHTTYPFRRLETPTGSAPDCLPMIIHTLHLGITS